MSGYDYGSHDSFSQDFDALDFFGGLEADESSTVDQEPEMITKTMLASFNDIKENRGVFFDERTFAERNITHKTESDLPDDIIAVRFTGKRGEKTVQAETKAEFKGLLDQLDHIEFHARGRDGEEVVRSLSTRNVTVGQMSDEEYAEIHGAAMRSLAELAEKYREHAEAVDDESPSIQLSNHRFVDQTGRDEKKLPVGGLFPTVVSLSNPNRAETTQLRDEKAFQEDAIRQQHVKERDDAHAQRLDDHDIKEQRKSEILSSLIKGVVREVPGKNSEAA